MKDGFVVLPVLPRITYMVWHEVPDRSLPGTESRHGRSALLVHVRVYNGTFFEIYL
jgi:hypothetical protein